MLVLLEMGDWTPCEKNGKVLERILVALSGSTRGTDITGWYRNNAVLGVIFTEFAFNADHLNTIPSILVTRVVDTLRKNLSEEQFDQACISFHVFPEEWNHDIHETPTDPEAPVYSPLKPKPNLRSGGATAVPEHDDLADLAKTLPVSRRLL